METLPQISPNTFPSPWSGKSTEDNLAILWKIWMWIWLFGRMFLNSTHGAAVYLGKDNDTNLKHTKNHLWDCLGQFFCETKRLISEQSEILGAKHQRSLLWKQLNLKKLRDQQACCSKELTRTPMLKCTSSPTHCFVRERSEMFQTQLGRIKLNGMERTIISRKWIASTACREFEWKMFTGFTTLGIIQLFKSWCKSIQCQLEHFNGRVIFMSMCDDIAWGQNPISFEVRSKVPLRSLVILGAWIRKEMVRDLFQWTSRKLDRTAGMMILQLDIESSHPIFRVSSAFERGI